MYRGADLLVFDGGQGGSFVIVFGSFSPQIAIAIRSSYFS